MLGLHVARPEVDALFEEFDTDSNDSISFRELNRVLRRDVKVESKAKEKAAATGTREEMVDLDALRKQIKLGMMSFVNVQLAGEKPDPILG